MKFFSRKALIASATAVAVAFGGASVASAQDNTPSATATPTATATATPTPSKDGSKDADDSKKPETTTDANDKKDEGSSISDMEPKEIRDWIAVFTAVIGALGTLLAFLDKYFDLPF
ncbi:hypothetical protein [Corynebacterium phoceense]|uniref:hypothetical protein n=1 Tax=Corynebacterium phoceense TaxID=1686286 RepID=UPI00211B9333|nr:hypothetical protein [Corynebacterium phoceense]MCQ9339592.1 hypothetical protein [Corynebacterium phoceense]MCQ9344679.1 hypothetical protein [Corynebacterium phoceense]